MRTSRHLPITEKLRNIESAIDSVNQIEKKIDQLVALERLILLKASVKNT